MMTSNIQLMITPVNITLMKNLINHLGLNPLVCQKEQKKNDRMNGYLNIIKPLNINFPLSLYRRLGLTLILRKGGGSCNPFHYFFFNNVFVFVLFCFVSTAFFWTINCAKRFSVIVFTSYMHLLKYMRWNFGVSFGWEWGSRQRLWWGLVGEIP